MALQPKILSHTKMYLVILFIQLNRCFKNIKPNYMKFVMYTILIVNVTEIESILITIKLPDKIILLYCY